VYNISSFETIISLLPVAERIFYWYRNFFPLFSNVSIHHRPATDPVAFSPVPVPESVFEQFRIAFCILTPVPVLFLLLINVFFIIDRLWIQLHAARHRYRYLFWNKTGLRFHYYICTGTFSAVM
jgi:hypothetical protein